MNIVSLLKDGAKEIDFDLTERADYLDPEKLERTVFVSPLAANVTKEMVKVCKMYVCLFLFTGL